MVTLMVSGGINTSEAAKKIKETKCRLEFSIKGWSIFYQTAGGTGVISCDNGQSSNVVIDIKGGGLTAGKYKLSGTGVFSGVENITELYGAYARAEAHAGVVKAAGAQVVTKGDISLALSAKGKGIDLGVAFGSFRIKPAGKK